jgi:hypothetical protein
MMRCCLAPEKLKGNGCFVIRIFIHEGRVAEDPGLSNGVVAVHKADIEIAGCTFPERLMDGTSGNVRPGFVSKGIIMDQRDRIVPGISEKIGCQPAAGPGFLHNA